jgi:hypothetical protein
MLITLIADNIAIIHAIQLYPLLKHPQFAIETNKIVKIIFNENPSRVVPNTYISKPIPKIDKRRTAFAIEHKRKLYFIIYIVVVIFI